MTLTALPGGRAASHVTNLRPGRARIDTLAVRPVFLTALEASLEINVLRASDSQAVRDLGDDLAAQWSRPQHPSVSDDAPAHGYPRPC